MAKLKVPVGPDDHAQGPADAPVTLLEYGDYECSHCGHAYPIVKALQKKLGKQSRFVFRNFPLREIHPNAEVAAETAEFAATRGKFWDMHDLIFENQIFRAFAGGLFQRRVQRGKRYTDIFYQ